MVFCVDTWTAYQWHAKDGAVRGRAVSTWCRSFSRIYCKRVLCLPAEVGTLSSTSAIPLLLFHLDWQCGGRQVWGGGFSNLFCVSGVSFKCNKQEKVPSWCSSHLQAQREAVGTLLSPLSSPPTLLPVFYLLQVPNTLATPLHPTYVDETWASAFLKEMGKSEIGTDCWFKKRTKQRHRPVAPNLFYTGTPFFGTTIHQPLPSLP